MSAPMRPAPRLLVLAASDTDGAAVAGGMAYAPSARVVDSAGAPASEVVVRFALTNGEGVLVTSETITDARGFASAGGWTTGTTPGVQEVRASLVGEPPQNRALAATANGLEARFRATVVPATGPLRVDARCPISDSLLPSGWMLPRVAARLQAREPLTIVAIGSSSTAGAGATVADSTYPALLQRHLRRAYPASSIRVINAGIGGQNLAQIRARFANDVLAAAPHLVVLQTGTIDAMYGVPLDTFALQLRAALASIAAAGADIILLDSQFYPGFGESARYREFQATLARIGAERGVPVARRYAWMRELQQGATYTWSELLASDVFHPSDLTYSCTGRYLADGVVRAVAGAVAH